MTLELHPWNEGFEWNACGAYGRRALATDEVKHFDERGFVVLEDLIDAHTVRRTIDEIDAIEARVERALAEQPDGRIAIAEAGAITFAPHLVTQAETLRDLARDTRIANVCLDLIGPDVNLYWDQAVYKKPEKPRRFPWHQDNGYAFVEPQQYLTVWLALTDATLSNGCPWVVPGLHKLGTLRHTYVEPLGFECFETSDDALAAPVPAGGAVVFSSLTPHLTGPNTTDAVRKAYILQYAPVGASVLTGDPATGPPVDRIPCDDPDRQFAVARRGHPVTTSKIPPALG